MSNGTEQIFLPDSVSNLPLDMEMMARPGNGAPTINTINLENVSDFTKVCRVCATVTHLVMPIFSGEGLRINLADKIRRHLPITVTTDDVLPLVVCYQCTSTLLATHELVACSLQADAALRTAREQYERQQRQQRQMALDATEGLVDDQPGNYRRCEFCPLLVLGALYNSHLLGRHADLLFHCAECNNYVSRTRFLAHMTRHANQYDAEGRRAAPKPPTPDAPAYSPPAPPPALDSTTTAAADSTTAPASPDLPAADDHVSEAEDEAPPPPPPPPPPPAPRPPAPVQRTRRVPRAEQNPRPQPAKLHFVPIRPKPGPYAIDLIENSTPAMSDDATVKQAGGKTVRQCPHCPKTYTANSSYFYHLKYTHRNSREHECDTCGRRFGTRGGLREHAALHEPSAGLPCEHCGKRFRTRAARYIHERTHEPEGTKRFQCGVCGRAFRWRAGLQRHAARHAAGRGHACECGRAFSVRADLLRHARTHRGAAHACPHAPCRATFAQGRYLRAHVARKHAALSAPPAPQDQRESA